MGDFCEKCGYAYPCRCLPETKKRELPVDNIVSVHIPGLDRMSEKTKNAIFNMIQTVVSTYVDKDGNELPKINDDIDDIF